MPTVLYVEDNPLNMRLVEKSLKPMNYQLQKAWDGSEGIEVATEQQPDLILLDLHLPDIIGTEVAEALRTNPTTAHIPIVALTADITASVKRECLNGNFDAYLTKPVRRATLLRTIKQMLETSVPSAATI